MAPVRKRVSGVTWLVIRLGFMFPGRYSTFMIGAAGFDVDPTAAVCLCWVLGVDAVENATYFSRSSLG